MPAWRSASPKKWKTPAEDVAHDARHELRDVPEGRDPVLGNDSQVRPIRPVYLITEISGWVASSVCVNT